ncbi:MAG: lytic transglycosylase domain-containing protein [Treponema sp.]|jgi:soluble lytic murein transglycosylase|nr:lytic transglycosylase domain-containing protein [Treponema sp.]
MGQLISVLLVFFLGLSSCAAQQQKTDFTEFYEGLKKRQDGASAEAAGCFAKALNAANTVIAAAAAAELMDLHTGGVDLSAATMTLIRQKADGSWARALDVFTAEQGGIDREKFLALLLNGDSRAWDEAVRYVLHQWRTSMADNVIDNTDDNTADSVVDSTAENTVDSVAAGGTVDLSLTQAENAAIAGRSAVSRSRYNEALIFFRSTLHDSPDLFFRYPDLLTDLGRSFQYAATGREGADLFLQWETMLSAGENTAGQGKASPQAAAPKTALREFIPDGSENLVRFRLLFFAGRIARQHGEKNSGLFERALPYALEIAPEQADACIWYILDSSLAQDTDKTIRSLETYVSQWRDDAYFSDILDKLARELVFRRQWEKVYKVFTVLRNRPGAITAHFAWIIGRAIEEGLFVPEKSAPDGEYARVYMRIAYNAAGNVASAMPLYYRSLSAAALSETFLALPEEPPPDTAKPQSVQTVSDIMQFLMGFFENDAARYASRYIKAAENNLSPEELYRLAKALNTAGRYQESMRLVALYANRNDYYLTRGDLELLYPRPFKELVEQYARETGIEPSLLFGLIRTESAFDPAIVSRAGAAGLTQLMPATAEEMAARIRRRGGPDYIRNGEDSAIDLRDPAVNIHIGAVYLAYLNERMEDSLLALLAYNGGMNRVRRWRTAAGRFTGASLPPDLFLEMVEYPETRNYGRSVMGAAAMYKKLYFF